MMAIFTAGLALGVVLGAVVLERLMSTPGAQIGQATRVAPAAPAQATALPAPGGPAEQLVPAPHVAPEAARASRARSEATSSAETSERGMVRIDPAMLQNLGVRTALVEPRTVTESIHTTGYVDYDQRRVSRINARVSGWVEKLYVAYTGQPVRRGETLLEIFSPELVLTQEDYLRARRLAQTQGAGEGATRQYGTDLMSAAETRLRLWGISPSELRKVEKRGKPSETVPIQSPSSGVVTESKVVEGAHVRAGDDLYTIADLSEVWVYADIYESELPKVHTNQQAEVAADALPGQHFDGAVTYIYPSVNEQTRTVRVRLEFTNPGRVLRPGMYVKVTLQNRTPAATLTVPAEAVLDSGVRKIVIVALGNGRFEPREVKVGTRSEGYFQVLSGVEHGERVVTSAQFLIDSESNLNEALSAMTLGATPQTSSPASSGAAPAASAK